MERVDRIVRSLGWQRLAILAAVLLASIGFFVWVIGRLSAPQYGLLYGELDMAEAARVVAKLEASDVPYRLEQGGTAVFIPSAQVARMRVALAEQGIPAGGSLGYELFDQVDAFTSTSFQQNVNLVRALEGELARTIRGIETVKTARVHLVLPKRELFSRDKQQASASVLLQMRGSARLTPAQVAAVQQLIASAVPELPPERISIVDGHGTLLSESDRDGGLAGVTASKAEERRRQLESQLTLAIEQLLERTLGPGRVRAQVYADLDFDRVNTSEELFDPEGQVVRSTQSVNRSSKNCDGSPQQTVTVTNNLPNSEGASGAGPTSEGSESDAEETVNYEISKKVISHVREAGIIRRLSVAVLVDGSYGPDSSGASTYQPRPQGELDQLATLVRSAIGFNAERGDRLEVINMRFVDPVAGIADEGGLLAGLSTQDLLRIGQYVLLSTFAALILIFVVRPVLTRALVPLPSVVGVGQPGLLRSGAPTTSLPGPERNLALEGAPRMISDGATDSSSADINIAGIEGKLKATLIQSVAQVVERHPQETLAIVRNWLHGDE